MKKCSHSAFAAGFYEALAFGKSVQTAFEMGRVQMGLLATPDAGAALAGNQQSRSLRKEESEDKVPSEKEIPQLLLREGVDPTKLVLAPRLDQFAAAASSASDRSTQSMTFGSINISGNGNKSTTNQNITYASGGSASASLVDQSLKVANVSITGEDNSADFIQNGIQGSTASLTSSSLTSFHQSQATGVVTELKKQLSSATPDRASFVDPLDTLRHHVAAAPELKKQLDHLSALINQLPA